MRAIALILTLMATLPLGFVAPQLGLLIWAWLSFMNPHQSIYMSGLPVVYLSAVVTAVGLVMSREPKRLPNNLAPYVLMLWALWTTVTTIFALDQNSAWLEWNPNIKTFILALTIMVVMTNRIRIHALVWVYVLSIGYFSLKGGLFTLLTGGSSHVMGIQGTVTGDNNNLGLVMVMSWPLIYYLRLHTANKYIKLGLLILMGCTVIAVLGTYSRGAFLALFAVAGYFWWKAKRKVAVGIFGAIVLLPAVLFMPQQWVERISTIDTYQEDGSAMGRIHQWGFALRIVGDHPITGGGYDAGQSSYVVHKFYPDEIILAYHSIWFQALGDQGIPGLAIFLSIAFVSWRNASAVRRRARSRPELTWAGDLATMCQVSLAGYFLAGSFLSMAYYDGYYAMVAVLAVLRDVATKPALAEARAQLVAARTATVPAGARYAAQSLPRKSA